MPDALVELRHERGESTGDAVNRLHRKPTHYKQIQKKKNGIRCRVNKRRERRGETKTIFSFPQKIFAKREKKGWGRLTACIAGHAIQRKNPQDESQRFSKWRLPTLPQRSAVPSAMLSLAAALAPPRLSPSPAPLRPPRAAGAHTAARPAPLMHCERGTAPLTHGT